MIDGMAVYYGGDLCDSDDSDWDDPYDIASAEYVYNFDVPEGMELMVHERGRGPYGSEMRENEGTGLTHVCQTTLSYPRDELDTVDVDPLAEVFAKRISVPDVFFIRKQFRLMKGISVIRTMDLLRTKKGILGRIGAILHFGAHLAPFRQKWTVRSGRLRSVTDCFRRRCWPIRPFRFMRNCLCWHCGSSRTWG